MGSGSSGGAVGAEGSGPPTRIVLMVRLLPLPLPLVLLALLVVLEQDAVEEVDVERRSAGGGAREAVMEGERMRSFRSRKEKRLASAAEQEEEEGEEGEQLLAGFFTICGRVG
jgi:hypothetical protein